MYRSNVVYLSVYLFSNWITRQRNDKYHVYIYHVFVWFILASCVFVSVVWYRIIIIRIYFSDYTINNGNNFILFTFYLLLFCLFDYGWCRNACFITMDLYSLDLYYFRLVQIVLFYVSDYNWCTLLAHYSASLLIWSWPGQLLFVLFTRKLYLTKIG